MISNNFNLHQLKVFEAVYRTGSMTLAAQEMNLTQSGVSQHMKSLEDALDLVLFDRIKQRLIPTDSAKTLYEKCRIGFEAIEQALVDAKGGQRELVGRVAIGIPIEFGNNLVLPKIAKIIETHPGLQFTFKMGFASSMNEHLLDGDLDFAFIDDFAVDKSIITEKVYDEVLELCILEDMFKKYGLPKNEKRYYESLPYVEYQPGSPILKLWFSHHLNSKNIDLNVRGTIMDVQGVARLILGGVGAGVLPSHVSEKLIKDGHKLVLFKGCGKPLKNKISMAYLRDKTHSKAALEVMLHLKTYLSEK